MTNARCQKRSYDELLKDFGELADEQVEGLESALTSGNDNEARELAHSLKGAAGHLRLDDCLAVVSAIELALYGTPEGWVPGAAGRAGLGT